MVPRKPEGDEQRDQRHQPDHGDATHRLFMRRFGDGACLLSFCHSLSHNRRVSKNSAENMVAMTMPANAAAAGPG